MAAAPLQALRQLNTKCILFTRAKEFFTQLPYGRAGFSGLVLCTSC